MAFQLFPFVLGVKAAHTMRRAYEHNWNIPDTLSALGEDAKSLIPKPVRIDFIMMNLATAESYGEVLDALRSVQKLSDEPDSKRIWNAVCKGLANAAYHEILQASFKSTAPNTDLASLYHGLMIHGAFGEVLEPMIRDRVLLTLAALHGKGATEEDRQLVGVYQLFDVEGNESMQRNLVQIPEIQVVVQQYPGSVSALAVCRVLGMKNRAGKHSDPAKFAREIIAAHETKTAS